MRMPYLCATPFGGVADASRDWPVGENVPRAVPQPSVDQRTIGGDYCSIESAHDVRGHGMRRSKRFAHVGWC